MGKMMRRRPVLKRHFYSGRVSGICPVRGCRRSSGQTSREQNPWLQGFKSKPIRS
jgi:hypothetical protein